MTTEDQAQLEKFQTEIGRWADWRDGQGRRAFAIPTSQASDDPEVMELDKITMSDWMTQHGLTSERLRWFVDYSCRDDYGLSIDDTSAWAGLLYFASRMTKSGAEHQPLITWPEGNGRIISYLASTAKDRLKTGLAVTRIVPSTVGGQSQVEVECYDVTRQKAVGYRAKRVIFAAPQFLAPYLIDGFRERTGRETRQFNYGSWLVANVHLKQRPTEHSFPLCWDNVIHGSKSLGYVVATHQAGLDYGPTVMTWYYPICDLDPKRERQAMLEANWRDLAELVLTDLSIPHPDIRNLVSRLDIYRWGHAMVRPTRGSISSEHLNRARVPDGPIHFGNTDLSGVALFEEAFDHGCRAAEEVVGG
jgi:hypothetical protein